MPFWWSDGAPAHELLLRSLPVVPQRRSLQAKVPKGTTERVPCWAGRHWANAELASAIGRPDTADRQLLDRDSAAARASGAATQRAHTMEAEQTSTSQPAAPELPTLTLDVLQIVKDAQGLHGLKHSDYQRYRRAGRPGEALMDCTMPKWRPAIACRSPLGRDSAAAATAAERRRRRRPRCLTLPP